MFILVKIKTKHVDAMLNKKIFFLLFVSTGILSLTESFAQRSEKAYFTITEDKANKRVDITAGENPLPPTSIRKG